MKNLLILTLTAIAAVQTASAQQYDDNATGRHFYIEMGGPGVLLSANFDSRFERGAKIGFGYRIGAGFSTTTVDNSYDTRTCSYLTFPLGVNYVFGRSNSPHAFEVGAGITAMTRKVDLYNYYGNYKEGNFIGHFSFMYRLQPMGGGFSWRIGFTPIVGTAGDIMPSGAIGLGYSF